VVRQRYRVDYTDLDLLQKVKRDFPHLTLSTCHFEDSTYTRIPLSSIRGIYSDFRRHLKRRKLKFLRNSDCDNFALWFWSHVSQSFARRTEIVQSVAFGVVKFTLDPRKEYSFVGQKHMVNWFLDEEGVFRFWEPQDIGVDLFEMSSAEKKSIEYFMSW
jgi:hypothetical protein